MKFIQKKFEQFLNNFIPAKCYGHPLLTMIANMQGMFWSRVFSLFVTFCLGLLRLSQMPSPKRSKQVYPSVNVAVQLFKQLASVVLKAT